MDRVTVEKTVTLQATAVRISYLTLYVCSLISETKLKQETVGTQNMQHRNCVYTLGLPQNKKQWFCQCE